MRIRRLIIILLRNSKLFKSKGCTRTGQNDYKSIFYADFSIDLSLHGNPNKM